MKKSALDIALDFNIGKEAKKSWMYLDIKGLVTTGIGCQITVDAAKKLPFFHEKKNGAKATEAEIVEAYEVLRKQSFGQGGTAEKYLALNDLRLTNQAITELAKQRINSLDQLARARFPGYDQFPADAQLAINSYMYATGHLDNKSEPGLFKAILAQDWWRASAECYMSDEIKGNAGLIPRNTANQQLFANAGRVKAGHFDLDPDILYFKSPGAKRHYFFGEQGQYNRYDWDLGDDFSRGFDFSTPGDLLAWKLPSDFAADVRTIFNGSCNGFCDKRQLPHTGKTYFVSRKGTYLVYDWNTDELESGTPCPLGDLGLTGVFAQKLDTVVRGRGQYRNKLYFFSGNSYVRYDLNTNLVDWGPESLDTWKLPNGFNDGQGIDTAINGEGKHQDKLFIFRSPYYVKYNWNSRVWGPEPGYMDANKDPTALVGKGWTHFDKSGVGNQIYNAINAGVA